MNIRLAHKSDVAALVALYAPYVEILLLHLNVRFPASKNLPIALKGLWENILIWWQKKMEQF